MIFPQWVFVYQYTKGNEKFVNSLWFILKIPGVQFICIQIWHPHKHASLFSSVSQAPLATLLVLSSKINSAQTTLFIQNDIKMFTLHKNKHIDDVNACSSFSVEHLHLTTAERCMTFSLHFSFQHVTIALYLSSVTSARFLRFNLNF